MDNTNNIEIHETAFVTATFRSLNEDLSGDYYAKLWNNNKTNLWMNDYLSKVSTEDVYTHCIRNRYFLDKTKALIKEHKIEVLINFGSGFSMYPFLLDEALIHIEIDKPEIVNYKRLKINEWQGQEQLPKREVNFIGVDFSQDYEQELFSKINDITQGKPSFILIEGVLFFLNLNETNRIFDFFTKLQKSNDYIGSVSYRSTIKKTTAFKKLIAFFNEKVTKTSADDYLTLEDDYYKTIQNYSLIDHQDYFSISTKLKHTITEPEDAILNEHFYLLKRA
jgi:O-methyltransferase involved in polyketide biosynthesis